MGASQVALVVKNQPSSAGDAGDASAGDAGDVSSIPGLGRSPGGGRGNPLQYSCLENPMDRGAWRARVHRVAKSRAQLKWLSTHTQMYILLKYSILPGKLVDKCCPKPRKRPPPSQPPNSSSGRTFIFPAFPLATELLKTWVTRDHEGLHWRYSFW